MRRSAPVRDHMSRLPEEIDRREPLASAIERMDARHVHHLPVMDGAHLFGMLSLQDVHEAWRRFGAAAGKRAVGDVCTREVLRVEPVAAIGDVAAAMLERGVTGALVVDGDVLVGVFTSVDALRVIADG